MKISKLSNSIRPRYGRAPLDIMLAVYMPWDRTQPHQGSDVNV